jgi:copper chaperone NosL
VAESRVLDELNCQVNYETSHPDEAILARWSHDYKTMDWLHAEDAFFVRSPRLMAPMASETAALSRRADADALANEVDGEVLAFDQAWDALR